MTKEQIGLFEKLGLTEWYKYLLYISGIILILAFFFESPVFEQRRIVDFSLWTIGLSCFVWIFQNGLRNIFNYYDEKRDEINPELTEEQEWILITREVINVFCFLGWILIVVRTLFR